MTFWDAVIRCLLVFSTATVVALVTGAAAGSSITYLICRSRRQGRQVAAAMKQVPFEPGLVRVSDR